MSFDHLADEAATRRFEQIAEHYDARIEALEEQTFGAPPYKPVPPERMFFDAGTWAAALKHAQRLPPDALRGGRGRRTCAPGAGAAGARSPPSASRATSTCSTRWSRTCKRLHEEHRRVIVAAWTPGARERLSTLLADHGLKDVTKVDTYADALALPAGVDRARRAWAWSRASRRRSSPSSASRTSSATASCARGASSARPSTSSPRRRACRSATSSCTPTTASAALRA